MKSSCGRKRLRAEYIKKAPQAVVTHGPLVHGRGMTSLKYVRGDATRPQGSGPRVLVHCCNDSGGWGSGFVVAVSKRWAEPEKSYRSWAKEGSWQGVPFDLGYVQFVPVEIDLWVANLIGQHRTIAMGEPTPVRYTAIEEGLKRVSSFCLEKGASLHMPRMGAGLARGDWKKIEEIILHTVVSAGIPVTVYDFASV